MRSAIIDLVKANKEPGVMNPPSMLESTLSMDLGRDQTRQLMEIAAGTQTRLESILTDIDSLLTGMDVGFDRESRKPVYASGCWLNGPEASGSNSRVN